VRLIYLVSFRPNINSRICSAPPTISPKVHYIVNTPCEKAKTSDGAWMLLSTTAWVCFRSVGRRFHPCTRCGDRECTVTNSPLDSWLEEVVVAECAQWRTWWNDHSIYLPKFLSVCHCKYSSILYRFRDVWRRRILWPWKLGYGSFTPTNLSDMHNTRGDQKVLQFSMMHKRHRQNSCIIFQYNLPPHQHICDICQKVPLFRSNRIIEACCRDTTPWVTSSMRIP